MKHLSSFSLWAMVLLLTRFASAQSLDPTFAPTTLKANFSPSSPFVRALLPQPDGKVVVAGEYDFVDGVLTSKVRRLNPDGSLDAAFLAQTGSGPEINGPQALALQADGKILVAQANAVYYNGVYAPGLVRLNANGSVDATFNAGNVGFDPFITFNVSLRCLAVQPDGKILVGGRTVSYNGQAINSLLRINPDGSIDNSFAIGSGVQMGAGAGLVETILVQADGKIVIGGSFNRVNGTTINNLARLNANGTLDGTFGIGAGTNSSVRVLAQQADGKLLVGGLFTQLNGQPSGSMLRLSLDGSRDNSFQAGTVSTASGNGIYRLRLRADGSMFLMGMFSTYNGVARGGVVKVSSTGVVDPGFAAGSGVGTGTFLYDLAELPTGQLLVGGNFSTYNGTARTGLARLSSTGDLDPGYNPVHEFRGSVSSAIPLANGRVLIQGNIAEFNGSPVATNTSLHIINADGTYNSAFTPGLVGSYLPLPDGRFYVSRSTGSGSIGAYTLSRLLGDGTQDNSFAPVTFGYATNTITHVPVVRVLPSGDLIVTGSFTNVNGTPRLNLARILANGILDNGFVPTGAPWQATGTNQVPPRVTPLANGQLMLDWVDADLQRSNLIRLNANGSVDNTFSVGARTFAGFIGVTALPNGQLLVTGRFTSLGGVAAPNGAVRLGLTGIPDPNFNVATTIRVLLVQPDGRMLTLRNPNTPTTQLVRLLADGGLDTSFAPVAAPSDFYGTNAINQVVFLPGDNKLLLTGTFTSIAGQTRMGLARLSNVPLSTRAAQSKLTLTAYPNPADHTLRLQLPAPTTADPVTATLLDLQGRVVRRWAVAPRQTALELPLHGVAAGLYLVQVPTTAGPAQQRVAVRH